MRKHSIKANLVLIILILSTLFSAVSCQKKQVIRYCEIGIEISDDYVEVADEDSSFDVSYTDEQTVIGITRISFDAGVKDNIPPTLTPLKFGEHYLKRIGIEAEITKHGYIPYASYTVKDADSSIDYLDSFYRTDYAYFIITFATASPNGEDMKQEYLSCIETAFYKYN